MTSGQQRQGDHKRSRPGGERPLASPRTTEAPERSDQQAIPALEHDRRKRSGDHRQRVALEAGARWHRGRGYLHGPLPSGSRASQLDRSRFYAGSGPTSSAHPITRIGAAAASAEMGRECTRGRWRSSMRRLPDADSSQTARRWTREPKRSRRKSGAGGAHWRARPARTPSSGVRNHAELAEAPPRAVRDRPARMRRPAPPFF